MFLLSIDVYDAKATQTCVARMYQSTQHGEPVVTEEPFRPWAYLSVPNNYTKQAVELFLKELELLDPAPLLVKLERRYRAMGYDSKKHLYAKVSFSTLAACSEFQKRFSNTTAALPTLAKLQGRTSKVIVHPYIPGTFRAFAPSASLAFQIERDVKVGEWKGSSSSFPSLKVCAVNVSTSHPLLWCARLRGTVNTVEMVFQRHGDDRPERRVRLTTNPVEPDAAWGQEKYEDEEALMNRFTDILSGENPDIIVGYGNYSTNQGLWDRLKRCDCAAKQSRDPNRPSSYSKKPPRKGTGAYHLIDRAGRIEIDVKEAIKNAHNRLKSYKLEAVAKHFLGEEEASRCEATLRLLFRLNILENAFEMARVCGGMSATDVLTRGEGAKFKTMVTRYAIEHGYALNRDLHGAGAKGFQGGRIFEPLPGFRSSPVAVLDFTSLYPSIMIEHNLCFSTRRGGDRNFVPATERRGIVPALLSDLIDARTTAKSNGDDVRQLALKMAANTFPPFCSKSVIERTTAIGRALIESAAKTAKEMGATVVAGVTDSLFLTWNHSCSVAGVVACFERANEVAQAVSKGKIGMKVEGVLWPSVFLKKNQYVGRAFGGSEQQEPPTIVVKGLARRSDPPIVSKLYEKACEALLAAPRKGNPDLANAFEALEVGLKALVEAGCRPKCLDEYTLSVALKATASNGTAQPSHVLVNERIRARGGRPYEPGERVQMVWVHRESGKKAAEDPNHFNASKTMKLDLVRYVEAAQGPLSDLFGDGARARVAALFYRYVKQAKTVQFPVCGKRSIEAFFEKRVHDGPSLSSPKKQRKQHVSSRTVFFQQPATH